MPTPDPRARAARTDRTAALVADLATLASELEPDREHLVLHGSIDERVLPRRTPLPLGTIDLRSGDALAHASTDPLAVVVVLDGHHRERPAAGDPRWELLHAADRTVATIVVSALTGSYHGLRVVGRRPGWLLGGVREASLGTELEVVLDDGTGGSVERTSIGALLHVDGATTRHRSVLEAVRALPRLPVDVRSTTLHAEELRALLTEADRLVPPRLRIEGR